MTLRDVIVDVFLFVATFRQRLNANNLPSVDQLYAEVRAIFSRMDAKVAGDAPLRARYERIKYGLVALVDEVIMTSRWDKAHQWPILEREIFGTQVAGDKFLESIGQLTPADHDLIEASFYILTLGFRGAYHYDEARWEQTVDSLYRQLPERMEDGPFQLTPEAYHIIRRDTKRLDPLFSLGKYLIVSAGLVFLSIMLYFVAWRTNVNAVQEKAQKAKTMIQDPSLKSSLEESDE